MTDLKKECCDTISKETQNSNMIFWKMYVDTKIKDYTLDSFEKEKFAEYLILLCNIGRVELSGTRGALILKALKKFYGIDFNENFVDGCWTEDFDYYQLLNKIKASLLKVKLPKKQSLIKQKFQWIGEIFELEKMDFELLVFIYMYQNDCILNLVDILSEKKRMFHLIYKNNFNVNLSFCTKKLCDAELVTYSTTNNDLVINSVINDLLQDETLNTKSKFIKKLIGKVQKTELTLKDFDHIKQIPLLKDILKNASEQHKRGVNILLYGFSGSGKTSLAIALAKESGLACYAVNTDNQDKDITREQRLFDMHTKQALLKNIPNTCLLFDEAEDIFNRGITEDGKSSKGYLNRMLENNHVPCIFTTNDIYNVDPAFMRRMNYILETPELNENQRYNLWKRITKKNKLKVSKGKLIELSQSYDVPPAIIANAVETTKLVNGGDETFDDVIESVAKIVTKKVEIKKKKDFDRTKYNIKLVNADTDLATLGEKIVKNGRLDFSMCLYGASGCGKSYWARNLCDMLGIDYILCKASDILSKWVGDNEANIASKFKEAAIKKCALIIDEADTFIQEREMAHSGWERSLTNELLVQMENFKYPFFCTTNLMDIIDSAAYRRFLLKIKFSYMTPENFKEGMKYFFKINTDAYLKGCTPADFAIVKKELEFFGQNDEQTVLELLQREIKVKKDTELKSNIGF